MDFRAVATTCCTLSRYWRPVERARLRLVVVLGAPKNPPNLYKGVLGFGLSHRSAGRPHGWPARIARDATLIRRNSAPLHWLAAHRIPSAAPAAFARIKRCNFARAAIIRDHYPRKIFGAPSHTTHQCASWLARFPTRRFRLAPGHPFRQNWPFGAPALRAFNISIAIKVRCRQR